MILPAFKEQTHRWAIQCAFLAKRSSRTTIMTDSRSKLKSRPDFTDPKKCSLARYINDNYITALSTSAPIAFVNYYTQRQ